MFFPNYRPRRLRQNQNFRRLVRETVLDINDLVMPFFVVEGKKIKEPIKSLEGQFSFSIDMLLKELKEVEALKIPAIILFGVPDTKDDKGSSAYKKDGIVQKAIREIKNKNFNFLIITDVCLCQYTNSGHCGFLDGDKIDNDSTIETLAQIALSHSEAGADIVAPSDMMDGRVFAIRDALDENNFNDVSIMSYAVKYCSSFYGPFRDAAQSAPQFGDRKSYQMDPANVKEAIRESMLDIEEGADILMVKPAMPYLDIIFRVKEETGYPVAAYNVSGEYAMIKTAAKHNLIDGKKVMLETLTSIKRAGADIILTYFAMEAAKELIKK